MQHSDVKKKVFLFFLGSLKKYINRRRTNLKDNRTKVAKEKLKYIDFF